MYLDLKVYANHACIQLNRADKANALNEAFLDEFILCIKKIQTLKNLKCIVFKSTSKNFCTGFDLLWLKEIVSLENDILVAKLEKLQNLLQLIDAINLVKIAQVQGYVIGAGVGIIACCDVVIANKNTILQLPELDHKLVPAIIWLYLTKAIGSKKAKYYTLTRKKIPAEQALQDGIVSILSDTANITSLTTNIVEQIAKTDINALKSLITIDTKKPAALLAKLLKT
jgi:methylglutaconyl-CoA hydratase